MHSDGISLGDFAYNDARAAIERAIYLQGRLDKAETRINYLGHIINELLDAIYGEDDMPEKLAEVIDLASKNW